MGNSISRTASYYLEFYRDLIVSFWDNITFWQYISVSLVLFTIGAMWLSKGAEGRT